MSIHYKFKSALESDTVTFDGLHISVRDLKNSIMQQKRIGKNNDFDLQVTNAETKEVFDNDDTLIPKNTSLLIARVPSLQAKPKVWEGYGDSSSPISKLDELGAIGKAMDLSSLDASEEDKIKAMMSQSTQDYDPSNYMKIRGANQVGLVPPNYRCYKCHQGGHWIKDCLLNQGTETVEIKKSTGIPRSFMVTVDGPQVQGAMITPNGSFAVPALDHQAYTEKSHPAPPLEESKTEIPEDLVCSLCSDLLTDAVMIPCCGDSYCDECIRSCLLESEEHECPACHEKDISPGTLIPNRYLRNSVTNFKSTTGYVKRPVYKPPPTPVKQAPQVPAIHSEPNIVKEQKDEDKTLVRPVVESSDNIEIKNSGIDAVEIPLNSESKSVRSLKEPNNKGNNMSPVDGGQDSQNVPSSLDPSAGTVQSITSVSGIPKRSLKNSNERSPRRRYHKLSPTYHHRNERSGTPTIDEPGIITSTSMDSHAVYPAPLYTSGPPPNMVMMGIPPPTMQGPVTNFVPTYPPPNPGPIQPNFRLPPPGGAPFVSGGYNPRPMYDMGRVPAYPAVYPPSSRSSKNRDFHREYSRRGRSPPTGIIDDPLEAFTRMLREKDERERRAKLRKARSYSRSSSRSITPSPPRKSRLSRSPRRRSRSRSFSISRSRSRSFSPGTRISPARNFSPKRLHRKMHTRYQSPNRSPQRFRFNNDDRDHRLDRARDNHGFNREGDRERDFRDRDPRDRDIKYYDSYQHNRGKGRQQWNGPRNQSEQYFQTPDMAVQRPFVPTNRYPQQDVYPPHIQQPPHQPLPQVQHVQPVRTYQDDVMPPGTEQPPVPGLENVPNIDERYQYTAPKIEPDPIKQEDILSNYDADQHWYDKMGGTPERKYSTPPQKQERDRDYQDIPEKHHKRRKHDDGLDRKKDVSDDERLSRRIKDKKKKKERREKKEEERKKRREKREKREQEKLNKRAAEDKERYERKHKREVIKHDAETQASNDEEEEEDNSEVPMYTDRINKYRHTREEPEHQTRQLEDSGHYDDVVQDHDDIKHNEEVKHLQEIDYASPRQQSPKSEYYQSPEKQNTDSDLYGDLLTDEIIDNSVIENYGKIKNSEDSSKLTEETVIDQKMQDALQDKDEGEITDDEEEESEKDILEIHTNEAELKIEVKNEVLAPVPERSKWEVDEDISIVATSSTLKGDSKLDKSDKLAKVTNEVLKRAENAIFAKAINAIRPIEIKKISVDRAKLYSDEQDKGDGDDLREEARNIHITITGGTSYDKDVVAVEPDKSPPKVRLSVKERLGCKVDELDRIVKIDKPYERNRSHSLSPLSRRSDLMSRNLGQGERRFDSDNRNRSNARVNFRDRNRDFHRQFRNSSRDNRRDIRNNNRNRRDIRQDRDRRKDDSRRSDKKIASKVDDSSDKKSRDRRKPSRSKSSSNEKDKHKRKDKRDKKKEKVKRHKKDGAETETNKQSTTKTSKSDDNKNTKMTSATDKRKPTLDEASFEPDYDLLESESEKEDSTKRDKSEKTKSESAKAVEADSSRKRSKTENKKYESSSSESSESSSEDDRKRRKHRKHKKRRTRRDSSSSSNSDTESESTDDDRDRNRRRHTKKKQKKRRKSKHKQ